MNVGDRARRSHEWSRSGAGDGRGGLRMCITYGQTGEQVSKRKRDVDCSFACKF